MLSNLSLNKLYHAILDLNYLDQVSKPEDQTNQLLSKIMNDFIEKYKNKFKDNIFILEYQDDLSSLISYIILTNIKSFYNFELKLYGKIKKTKKFFKFKPNKVSYLKDKKNITLISCFNPIYNVVPNKKKFKKFRDTYYLMDKFTPNDYIIASNFYALKDYLSNKFYYLTNSFRNFCDRNTITFNSPNKKYDFKLKLIKLTGTEEDYPIIDSVRKTKDLCFYFIEENKVKDLTQPFGFYMEHKYNTPSYKYNNLNSYSIVKELIVEGYEYEKIGNWNKNDDIEKELFLNSKITFIINGYPESGKTTFEKICKEKLEKNGISCSIMSIIDPIKEVAYKLGWDGEKDSKNRKFLSDLKDLLDSNFNYCINKTCDKFNSPKEINTNVTFIDVREPADIEKLNEIFVSRTIFIDRKPKNNNFNNHADSNVEDYNYDLIIDNNTTIENLAAAADILVEQVKYYKGGK